MIRAKYANNQQRYERLISARDEVERFLRKVNRAIKEYETSDYTMSGSHINGEVNRAALDVRIEMSKLQKGNHY